jgi:hypothetical protein
MDDTRRCPQIYHRFANFQANQNGTWTSDDYDIRPTSCGKGNTLFIKNPVPGLLIPFGGLSITDNELEARRINKNKKIGDYLISGMNTNWDANPDLLKSGFENCWPGAIANEATEGTPELFNCFYVIVDSCKYDVPNYPHVSKSDSMIFVEYMASAFKSRSRDVKEVEALVSYTRIRLTGSGRKSKQTYTAKLSIWPNYSHGGSGFGRHWLSCDNDEPGQAIHQLHDDYYISKRDTENCDGIKKRKERSKNLKLSRGELTVTGRHRPPIQLPKPPNKFGGKQTTNKIGRVYKSRPDMSYIT